MKRTEIKNKILKQLLFKYLKDDRLFSGSITESELEKVIDSFTLTENDEINAQKMGVENDIYLTILKEIILDIGKMVIEERHYKSSLMRSKKRSTRI